MAFLMMITVYSGIDKFTCEICRNCFIRIAFCSCAYLDAGLSESVLCTLSHAAADEHVDISFLKKPRKRFMSDSIGVHDLSTGDNAVLYIVYFKVFCSSKVLEHVSVFIRNCYFHLINPPVFCIAA